MRISETAYPDGPQPEPDAIPLAAVASQEVSVTLGGQACRIRLYARDLFVPVTTPISTDPPVYAQVRRLFMDLYLDDALLLSGVPCQTNNRIVRDAYLGFVGDLAFLDTVGGGDDPEVSGLGTRWVLSYWPRLT